MRGVKTKKDRGGIQFSSIEREEFGFVETAAVDVWVGAVGVVFYFCCWGKIERTLDQWVLVRFSAVYRQLEVVLSCL